MKKQRTILQQLLVNILVPVTVVFVLVFIFTYWYNVSTLKENTARQKESITAEARNLIAYFDYSLRVHEKTFIEDMRSVSDTLVNVVLKNEKNPAAIDLYKVSANLGLDTSRQHIYLIDRNMIVVSTTFPPDYKLNFNNVSSTFKPFFEEIFKGKVFREDRFGAEMKTGKIKKYSFQPLQDKYIVELGFYSDEATAFRKLLLDKIRSLGHRYPGIEKVQLYLGTKGIIEPGLDKRLVYDYLQCLETGTNRNKALDDPKTPVKETVDLVYLKVLDAQLYDGYVLEIKSNNKQERELLFDLIIYFGSIFLSAIILLFVIVYVRARRITNPIKELSAKTQSVSTDNLNMEKLDFSGSKELISLSGNFNSMMEKLRLSYEGLEEKVRERTSELNTQKELVEHKNEEIIDSINYARFIQRAILPPLADITTGFPESFVYYQPKDIIAGDFYWYERKGNVSWIAAGDCTGHGVPGAMISVLCINALNQVLLERKCDKPGELLDYVRESIVRSLSKESQSVKDGMDISIICYDHTSGEILWSGANNPLWIFRKEECEIIPADKQPIGQFDGASPFTTNKITVEEGDLLLLFTDGYADQFGGPKQKKFKYAAFRELVQENKYLPMQELNILLETTFNNWKGETEQTDDVCVIGIRF